MKSIFELTSNENVRRHCLSIARSFVLEQFPFATILITADKDGIKRRAAIYTLPGIELNERGNFAKEQHAPQRISSYEFWPNTSEIPLVVLTDLWLSAMHNLHKLHPELPRFDFVSMQEICQLQAEVTQ